MLSTISTRIIIAAVIAVLAIIACALYTIRLLRRRRQQRHADVVADRALHAMYTYLTLMLGTPQSQTTMQMVCMILDRFIPPADAESIFSGAEHITDDDVDKGRELLCIICDRFEHPLGFKPNNYLHLTAEGREQYDILYNAADPGGYFQCEDHDEHRD